MRLVSGGDGVAEKLASHFFTVESMMPRATDAKFYQSEIYFYVRKVLGADLRCLGCCRLPPTCDLFRSEMPSVPVEFSDTGRRRLSR
jgi:hypothetical protein